MIRRFGQQRTRFRQNRVSLLLDLRAPLTGGIVGKINLRQIGIEIALRQLRKVREYPIAPTLAHHDFERLLKLRVAVVRAQTSGSQPFVQHRRKTLVEPQRSIACAQKFASIDCGARLGQSPDRTIERRGGAIIARQHPVIGLSQSSHDIAAIGDEAAVSLDFVDGWTG